MVPPAASVLTADTLTCDYFTGNPLSGPLATGKSYSCGASGGARAYGAACSRQVGPATATITLTIRGPGRLR